MQKLTILVSGMIAAVPHQGGATWAVLQYLLGFRRLGHEVWFIEALQQAALQPTGASLARSSNAAYFRRVMAEIGLAERASLLLTGTRQTVGVSYAQLRTAAARADILLNIAGTLTDEALLNRVPVRAYLDLDPGFTQLWHATQGVDMRFTGHTHHLTVGQAIGQPDCIVPTCGVSWLPTLPPVVLACWPAATAVGCDALTTVANWRSYGAIEHAGVHYGQKAHSFRQLLSLPTRTAERFVLALAIHPAETKDREALEANGWEVLDPALVAATPDRYRRFILRSKAELGVAKSGYAAARCGWFSDRSACYLAAGRPVVGQETGFSRFLPTGQGLFAFATTDEALACIEELRGDYPRHARGARAVAEEYLDADKVLPRLLRQLGVVS